MKKALINFIPFLLSIVLLSSCLKDEDYEDGKIQLRTDNGQKIVELPAEPNHFHAIGLNLVNRDTTFNAITVGIAADAPVSEDVQVTLSLDQSSSILKEYNVEHSTSLEPLPTNLYTFNGTGLVVTIPKGSRYGYVSITVNPNRFDLSKTYALGARIVSVDKPGYILSSNFNKVIVVIGAKNKYDGIYRISGTLVDVTNATFGPWEPYWTAYLVTTGANSVVVIDMTYTGIEAHPFKNAGSSTYYGSFGMAITMDPNTNKVVNMTSPYEPAANTRTARLDPSGENFWDPVTQNFKIKYFMNQPSVVAGEPRTRFNETWTYMGPRP